MFLFKKTENLTKRIAMNMTVYGFAGCFVVMTLSPIIPKSISGFVLVLMCMFSFVACTGAAVFIVCFLVEIISLVIVEKDQKRQCNNQKPTPKQDKVLNVPRARSEECSLCGTSVTSVEEFNGKKYCYLCAAYYSSKYRVSDGTLIEKSTGNPLLKEVVLYKKPMRECYKGQEPTDFIISIFCDKVELKWGVAWRGGTSHADGAGGTELLDADYFETHTIDDFVDYLNSKPYLKQFVEWLNIKNNKKLKKLFAEKDKCKNT